MRRRRTDPDSDLYKFGKLEIQILIEMDFIAQIDTDIPKSVSRTETVHTAWHREREITVAFQKLRFEPLFRCGKGLTRPRRQKVWSSTTTKAGILLTLCE